MKKVQSLICHLLLLGVSFSLFSQDYEPEIGDIAPNIILNSPTELTYSLYSLEGKIVLINFWASWCQECLNETSNLRNLYEEFKDQEFINGTGFEIYNISLDINKESWLRMMNLFSINWTYNVSDLKGWNSKPALVYGIEDIPANVLIDGEAIVIDKNIFGENLRAKLESLLK